MNKFFDMISLSERKKNGDVVRDSLFYYLVIPFLILTLLFTFVISGDPFLSLGAFFIVFVIWIFLSMMLSKKIEERATYYASISDGEDLNNDTDKNLENLIKADLIDFLDGLCSNGDMERFTQQIISFLSGKKLGKATPIKLKYGNPDITQPYIKTEVSYYTYKIWLTLKKKKVQQKEISPHFFDTFGINFPKTEIDDFMAKLKERYEEYPKIKRRKML